MERNFTEWPLGSTDQGATLSIYRANQTRSNAVIMCPGGGFNQVAMDHEGYAFADWFHQQGITYAVLKYRMPHGHVEIIREDIREAIRLIRTRSAEWGIQQVGVMGASIGGYIAATAATLYHGTDRADFQILLYPVISMTDQLTHLPSRCRMLGENIPEAEKKALSLELHVTEETSSAFIVLAEDDQTVSPLNSLAYYTALLKHGVSAELHIYPQGGHSFGFCDSFIYKNLWTNELTEHFVCLHQVRNRLAGMEYRRMVLSSDRSPDNSQRRFRMLFAQVHRDLARLCDLTRTTRRLELLLRQSQVFTHHFLNVIDRNLLLRKLYVHFQYLLGQRDRNLFAEERCIRHQRRESSLYLTDIRIDIIGQEIDHLVRHIGPETKRFVTGQFLNIVDNQHVEHLVEVDEIIDLTRPHRIGKLGLEFVHRHIKYLHRRTALFSFHADRLRDMRLAKPRIPIYI